jgi:predicted amidohydrolase
VKIAAVQMISGPDVGPNLITAGRLMAEAAAEGAQLIVLPEYFPLIGATDADRLAARETEGTGPIQDFLATTAQRHGIWLIGGSIPLAASHPAKLRNSSLVFNPQGQRVARYDKMHLFGFSNGKENYDESLTIEPGNEPVTVEIDGLRVGIGICYDVRFPEFFRALKQPDLIVLPAAFTETTGRAHWETLLRARAIENLCYLVASAQGGQHPNGRMTHGNSMVIDPWGEILARIDKGEGIVSAEIDPQRLATVRASLPALQHRIL